MRSGSHRLRFGCFELDPEGRVLRKAGVKVRLQEQPFEVLLGLLETPGEVVTREQLRQRLWPHGTFVEFDHALNTAVKKIRAALCDDAGVPRFIETIPRRGYRFLVPVSICDKAESRSRVESGFAHAFGWGQERRWRTPLMAVAAAMPILLVIGWVALRPSLPRDVNLAVLPFSNMNPALSPVPQSAFPEILLRQLQRTHPSRLMIRDGVPAPAPILSGTRAEQAQIDYVLQGGVLGDEQHLHVTVQLVRLSDQHCVWTRDFERDADDAQAEREIAEEVVGQMQPTLSLLSGEAR